MTGITPNQGFEARVVGREQDQVHARLILPPTLPLSKAIQFLKGSWSKKLINDTSATKERLVWQKGYEAFSVSASQTEDARYIKNQIRRRIMKGGKGGDSMKSSSNSCENTLFPPIRPMRSASLCHPSGTTSICLATRRRSTGSNCRFERQYALHGVAHGTSSALRTASNSFNTSRSLVDSNALAPSDFASLGLSCTSRNTPSTPAATAARASTGINSG